MSEDSLKIEVYRRSINERPVKMDWPFEWGEDRYSERSVEERWVTGEENVASV